MSISTTVVTIDGPAGAGKSTVAKCIAKALGYSYLDTGAMYRALTLKALQHNLKMNDEDQLVALAKETHVDVKDGKVNLDGEDVTEAIRSSEITNNSFYVAQAPRVREVLVQWQRNVSQNRSIVVEGRDVGTVVFPKATHKFYLDANLDERSKRRVKELRENGTQVNEKQLTKEIEERDHKDLTRKSSPLKKADDAIVIDSTDLSVDEVVAVILKHIKK